MKKMFTLIPIFLLFAATSFAVNNRLSVSSVNDQQIRVIVDGRTYQQSRASNSEIELNDLSVGYHSIKVYRGVRGGRGRVEQVLIYNSNLYLRNGYHTDITINRFGKAFVDEQVLGKYEGQNGGYGNSGYGNSGNGHGSAGNGNAGNGSWNQQAMSERNFTQLKETLKQEKFDDNRIAIAKTAIRGQWISTAQVRDLLAVLSFEQNRLDLAKFCYQYSSDFENYYLLANAFAYSSSKSEFMRFIEDNRR